VLCELLGGVLAVVEWVGGVSVGGGEEEGGGEDSQVRRLLSRSHQHPTFQESYLYS
jgi:hypothetical protein